MIAINMMTSQEIQKVIALQMRTLFMIQTPSKLADPIRKIRGKLRLFKKF